ncbi:unnamed protein product, partial [Gadus morhua 'NCC']
MPTVAAAAPSLRDYGRCAGLAGPAGIQSLTGTLLFGITDRPWILDLANEEQLYSGSCLTCTPHRTALTVRTRTMHREKDLPELMAEKDSLDPSFVHAMRLLAEEIEKHEDDDGGKKEEEVKKYLDIISNKNIKLCERVLIPVLQYPKFNFVGKLLGPRGNSMKRLQEETGAKMSILGKGSMRDKGKEEELRRSGEAKYGHLSNDLHVLIEVFAPPGEAYTRMSSALDEIKKFLVP